MIVIVCQLGKPAQSLSLAEGTSIRYALAEMGIDPAGKTFTVVVAGNGPIRQGLDYVLRDGETLRISAANQAA